MLLVIGFMCLGATVNAHNLNFGTLTISESINADNLFQLSFQVSGDQGSHANASVGLPKECEAVESKSRAVTDKIRKRVSLTFLCDSSGFADKQFQLISMPPNSNILVRAKRGDELIEEKMMSGDTPFWSINAKNKAHVFTNYINLGVIHILVGWDHLLFLVMLMLLIPVGRKLVQVITAFTIGHSITLAMSTMGIIQIPVAPTEALIALSIVFLGAEVIRYHRLQTTSLTLRYPGVITSLFGLFHGLGFASVLNDIGVPQDQVVWSLVGFNIGVELGQLFFILVVLVFVAMLRKLPLSLKLSKTALARIGGVMGAFWLVERVAGF